MGERQRALEELVKRPSQAFWRGKRVFLTGHTGFKGAWLAWWLHRLGAQVTGYSLAPDSEPNLFTLAQVDGIADSRIDDIRDAAALRGAVIEAQPEVVLHLAAQALVRPSYATPVETFATNVMGTVNLLDALRGVDAVRAAVVVTTDKVYRNLERLEPYSEDDALGGHDPYSASKAAAELAASSFRDSFLREQGVSVATARAGNVIGGGDWSVDRLIPDAIRAWDAGEPLHLRRPSAVRPWQHVLEPLAGYLRLAEALYAGERCADAYNFGPDPAELIEVGELIRLAQVAYGRGEWSAGDGAEGPHEAGLLTLDAARAQRDLGVAPVWSTPDAVARTMAWYAHLSEGADPRTLCDADIDAYEAAV